MRVHAPYTGGMPWLLGRPFALLAGVAREAPHELGAQVLGLDDRVDHELGGELQDVDVLAVLAPQLARRTRARSSSSSIAWILL